VLGAYVILPNLPFLVANRFIYLERPVINLDYIALGLISPAFPKALNLALFSVILLLDMLFSTSGIYHFPVAHAIRALRSVGQVSLAVTIPILLLAGLAIFVIVRLASRWRRIGTNRSWRELAILLAGFALLDYGIALANPTSSVARFHLARSSVGTTALAVARDFRPLNLKPRNFWKIESATHKLNTDIESQSLRQENILLVVVESMGEAIDPTLDGWVKEPLMSDQIRRRYEVTTGTVEFEGSTVFGELRELCGVRSVGMRMTELQTSETGECLPAKLDAKGYSTVAIHGVTHAMFNRDRWYPTIGFKRMIFPDKWPHGDPRYCSTQFHAICDVDTATVVREELLHASQPSFVYWLTVESHLQLDDAVMRTLSGNCRGLVPDVCWMVTTQRKALENIAGIAMEAALKPTRFIVVGDHSPPFMLRSKRDLFAAHRVPWIELRPR
jgi:hypothetical protein